MTLLSGLEVNEHLIICRGQSDIASRIQKQWDIMFYFCKVSGIRTSENFNGSVVHTWALAQPVDAQTLQH